VESYPTPPPQVTTGYFPAPSPQTSYAQPPASTSQQQYFQSPIPVSCQQNPQQQYPSALPQQPQIGQYIPLANHQAQQQQQFSGSQQGQYQQQSYPTPVATPNSSHVAPVGPGAPNAQQMSPPRTPNSFNSPQPNSYVPLSYNQQTNGNPGYPAVGAPYNPPTQPINSSYHTQVNNFSQPPQQRQTMNGYQGQTQPPAQQYQQNGYINQTQAQPQNQAHKSHRTSMMGGSFLGGNMMNKMSSKFTQMQTRATGPPAQGRPGDKPSSDWKKWAKRGAIGVAGIGALALGVDAAGDMLSGAAGMDAAVGADFSGGGGDFTGGGGDFTGGGFEGGDATGAMDAQTAVDANAAQLAMEGIGQDNAQMLLDPVGTECKFCHFSPLQLPCHLFRELQLAFVILSHVRNIH
jgi:hypothetical protein